MKSSLQQFWELSKERHTERQTLVSGREGSYPETGFLALYTPLSELESIFESGYAKGTFVDLGCGGGLAPILYGTLFPDQNAIGIEFEKSRLSEGEEYLSQHPLPNVQLIEGDLLSDPIPVGDTYFLYFPAGPVLDRILCELHSMKQEFTLIVIESHGNLIPRLDLENWLELKTELPLKTERHYPFVKIYERTFTPRSSKLLPFQHTFRNHYLELEENGEVWIGRTTGMEWTEGERFELKTPPRTINWKHVKRLIPSLDGVVSRLVGLWDEGEVSINTSDRTYQGYIRKIIISPSFKLEISSGEKVELEKIQLISRGPHICYDSSSSC